MKSGVLLNFFALGALAAAHVVSEKRFVPEKRNECELGHSGQYAFVGCGADLGGRLSNVLQTLYTALLPIVQDALNSQTNPSAAYKAFFKNQANAIFVAQILTNVTTGTARHAPQPPWSNGNPTFFCPKPGCSFTMSMPDGSQVDAAAQCNLPDTAIASYLNPTPFIVLCPSFFTGLGGPITPPTDSCPTVNTAINRFRKKPSDYTSAGLSVVHCQIWILLEEIVHYYLFATPQITYLKPEVYDINKAWRLSAKLALSNAPNYAFYAATVYNQCHDYPVSKDDYGREILEADPDPDDPSDDGPDQAGAPFGVIDVVNFDIVGPANGPTS